MRRVGGEFPLDAEALLQAIERLVHRARERGDLVGQLVDGQANRERGRADGPGHVGRLQHRPQRLPHDDEVEQRQKKQDRQDQPGDALQEGRDDVVDHHVRVLEVLGDLHPDQGPAAGLGKAATVVDGRPVGLLEEGRLVGASGAGKQRRTVGQGREQHPPAVVEDGVGEAGKRLRIEGLQVGRQVQPPARAGVFERTGDGRLMPTQGLVLEAGSRRIQEQADRQRQGDGQDRHGHQMQPDDPPQQRLERRPHLPISDSR